jgi:hypothetical protein
MSSIANLTPEEHHDLVISLFKEGLHEYTSEELGRYILDTSKGVSDETAMKRLYESRTKKTA